MKVIKCILQLIMYPLALTALIIGSLYPRHYVECFILVTILGSMYYFRRIIGEIFLSSLWLISQYLLTTLLKRFISLINVNNKEIKANV